jgi:hypothetical protein
MRNLAPLSNHGGCRLPRVEAPHQHQRQADDVRDLPGDRGEDLGRRRPAGHQRRDPPQRALARSHHRLALAQLLLGPQAVLDVGERRDGAAALRHLDRHRDIGDGKRRAITPEEPVQIARDRLPLRMRQPHRALRGPIRRPVRVLVVDRLVAMAPEQLVRAVVAERRDRGGVGEPDHVIRIDDPDRRRGRLARGGEEILGTDPQANQIGQGMGWHAKPPGTPKSTFAPPGDVSPPPRGAKSPTGASDLRHRTDAWYRGRHG